MNDVYRDQLREMEAYKNALLSELSAAYSLIGRVNGIMSVAKTALDYQDGVMVANNMVECITRYVAIFDEEVKVIRNKNFSE